MVLTSHRCERICNDSSSSSSENIKIKRDEPLPKELLEKLIIFMTILRVLRVVRPSALREVLIESPNEVVSSWWLDDVTTIAGLLVLCSAESFTVWVSPPRGVLLFPPGAGKTLAKAIATSRGELYFGEAPSLLSMGLENQSAE